MSRFPRGEMKHFYFLAPLIGQSTSLSSATQKAMRRKLDIMCEERSVLTMSLYANLNEAKKIINQSPYISRDLQQTMAFETQLSL